MVRRAARRLPSTGRARRRRWPLRGSERRGATTRLRGTWDTCRTGTGPLGGPILTVTAPRRGRSCARRVSAAARGRGGGGATRKPPPAAGVGAVLAAARRPLLPHSPSLSRCRPLASFCKTHKLPHPGRSLAMAAAVRRRLGRRHHRGRGFGWPPSLRGAASRGGELRPVQWHGAAGAGAPTRPPCHWQFSLLFCCPSFSALRRRFPSPPAPHGTRFVRRHARPEELEGGGGKGGVNVHPRDPPRAPPPHLLRLSPLAVSTTIALTPSPRYEPPPLSSVLGTTAAAGDGGGTRRVAGVAEGVPAAAAMAKVAGGTVSAASVANATTAETSREGEGRRQQGMVTTRPQQRWRWRRQR